MYAVVLCLWYVVYSMSCALCMSCVLCSTVFYINFVVRSIYACCRYVVSCVRPVLKQIRAGALALLDIVPPLKAEVAMSGMGFSDAGNPMLRGRMR